MKYHAILIKFQVCWSKHVHSFLQVLDVPILSIDKIGEDILLVDNIVKVILPYFRVDLNVFDVVTMYQIHSQSKSYRKYKNLVCCYHSGNFFTNQTVITKFLPKGMSNVGKHMIFETH